MTEPEPPAFDESPSDDRIPVLHVRATPEEDEALSETFESGLVSDAEIEALAERVLDRIAPILHDALMETLDEYLAEHTEREGRNRTNRTDS
jgi:hypothetical protein